MKQKVAASFAIVVALAIIMPSSIFGSTEEGDGSEGESDSSEGEQPEEESDPETPEEETEPETEPETASVEEEPITAPELGGCPDGSQAATLEECPTATPTELVECPDGTQAATLAECPAAAAAPAAPTVAPSLAAPRLDIYAECIQFPFSMRCQDGKPTGPNQLVHSNPSLPYTNLT